MKRKPPSRTSSGRFLLAMVLIPLLWLIFVAWEGLESQTSNIRSMSASAAEALASRCTRDLGALTQQPMTVPKFNNPPLPGEASPLDEVLDSGDPARVRQVMDDPAAGNSPAGLPRQALAALILQSTAPESLPASDLVRCVTERYPSILTESLLEKMAQGEDDAAVEDWQMLEKLRAAVARNPELGWIVSDQRMQWLRDNGDSWQYVPSSRVEEVLRRIRESTRDFSITIRSAGTTRDSMTLAGASLGNLSIDVLLRPGNRYATLTRQAQRWGAITMSTATVACLAGIYLMHRTSSRERRLSEMKSQFVASVSHELRSPVASIRLMAEALDAGKVDAATAAEFHRLIAREGARLSTLVGNVLDHARIEQGRRIWKIEPCNLAELAADTVRVMEPLAQEKNITLQLAAPPIDSAVDADAIQQALVNLLDNAIKFSPPGTTVDIDLSSQEKGGTWRLQVRDQGPGVARTEQSRIFERFYRPGDELRRETQGTGIGLSLVKSIAEAHDGKVWVESEPGQGSTFILQFPRA